MTTAGSRSEILRGLARLVKGLSALFWGLPASLVLFVQTAKVDWPDRLGPFASAPAVIAACFVFYGLLQLEHFQPQERVWQAAVERCKILVLLNIGLAPFLHWWKRMPAQTLYSLSVIILCASALLFLIALNRLLVRLVAMLPDEGLRLETKLFTTFNQTLLCLIAGMAIGLMVFERVHELPLQIIEIVERIKAASSWLLTGFFLLPIALTMALVWKIKEVVFQSVFEWEERLH